MSRIIFEVFAVVCLLKTTFACMCMPAHSQTHLCGKNVYASLVKVRSMEYVYLAEKPKYKLTDTNDVSKNDDFKEKSEISSGLMGNVKKSLKKPEMERVEVVVKDLDNLSDKHLVASHIRYRVKVYETYKGLKPEETQGKKMYIYTAPDEGMCGIKLNTKEMYLLIGDIDGDRLNIGLCDRVIRWNNLDSKQKRVIRRNMRNAKQTCASSCEIQTCTWSICGKPDKDSCMWTSEMEMTSLKLNIHPANYACTREPGKQDAKCTWNNALTNTKRRRRRRRHHSTSRAESQLREIVHLLP
ncbi:metalloproteinase inhibitor 2-like [Styela clava]|uniref:metalloproteinase inhibitor 2-like n=1 Tax=Styela clava TaxID=7725 RepID=UPI00193AB96C|nr:metalloproteinase inhibitor 2-like [Styela clava]